MMEDRNVFTWKDSIEIIGSKNYLFVGNEIFSRDELYTLRAMEVGNCLEEDFDIYFSQFVFNLWCEFNL
jgi:hypothetical protein